MTDKSESMMTTAEFHAMIEELGKLWSQNRAVETVDMFSVDTIWSNLPDQNAYVGREALRTAFAGFAAKSDPSPMLWHKWVFSEEKQLGFCEYTFVMAPKPDEDGSKGDSTSDSDDKTNYAHGVLWMQMENKLIKEYREIYYYSPKKWDKWVNCYNPNPDQPTDNP